MGNVLVVAEHRDGKLRKVTYPVISFAQRAAELVGGEVVGLLLGSGQRALADELAQHGVARVIYLDDASFTDFLAESYASAVAAIAGEVDAEVIAAPASIVGRDFTPRVADALGAGMAADVVALSKSGDELHFQRPMWSGNVLANIVVDTPVKVATIRTTEFPAAEAGDAAPVEERASGAGTDLSRFVAFETVQTERPDLSDADVIVSGGRGLREGKNFAMLEELADLFGGAVGASRAAVDSGMAPYDWQIGQTGKIVAPNLYFAIAISGAIQHLAGMKGSKNIVAINKDPEAPIFQVSDYGLVADAFKVVPELVEKIRAAKAE